jgi:hypothetical protein
VVGQGTLVDAASIPAGRFDICAAGGTIRLANNTGETQLVCLMHIGGS